MKLQFRGSILALCFCLLSNVSNAEFVEPSFAQERGPALPLQVQPLQWAECALMKGADGDVDLGMARASFKCPAAAVLMGLGTKVEGSKRQVKRLQLLLVGQKPLNLSFSEHWLAPFLDTVHSVDLNADGKPDFVLELSYHGNGLAAVRTQLIFLVSDAKGYRFTHFSNITSPALAQFASPIIADSEKPVATVFSIGRFASDFPKKPKTTDGKPHVFFVFDLLGFKPKESLPYLLTYRGFPRWVLFHNQSGAVETQLISAISKTRAWVSPMKGLRSGHLLP
jgi:hypothetical protein